VFEDVDNWFDVLNTATTTVERSNPHSANNEREQHSDHREQQPPLRLHHPEGS
jgi:hypothetical protein